MQGKQKVIIDLFKRGIEIKKTIGNKSNSMFSKTPTTKLLRLNVKHKSPARPRSFLTVQYHSKKDSGSFEVPLKDIKKLLNP